MGSWTDWEDIGGAILSAPSAASRETERITVVARNTTNKIAYRSWTESGGWDDWSDLGGPFAYDPAIIAYRPDRHTVYGVGNGQSAYRRTYIDGSGWEGGWSATNEATKIWSGLAAASAREGRIDLFGLNATNQVLHATAPPDTGWGPFNNIGGTLQGTVGAASWGTGRVDLVARGAASNTLWHRVLNGSTWSTWRDIGTGFLSGPAVCTWGPDRLDVFAKGQDHQILHRFWNGLTWSAWLDLGISGTDDNPAAVSRKEGNIELFIRGRDNHLYRRTYTADAAELDSGGVTDPS
ncbi:hypothetical protein [Streptomyces sp. RTd22]|uniref:hypothetical protein n=1 Tax=Streptomyces sp. RTd22 TaxID=1841249 RepID=UPI0007C45C66|nr:hypothetical protein [Streptomyces sp. RTd22]